MSLICILQASLQDLLIIFIFNKNTCLYIVLVYSPFSDRVRLPLHNTPLSRGVNEEYWSSVFSTGCPS